MPSPKKIVNESAVNAIRGVDHTALKALLVEMGYEVQAPAPAGVYVRPGMQVRISGGDTIFTVAPRGSYSGNYLLRENWIELYKENGDVTWHTTDSKSPMLHNGKRVLGYEGDKQ